MRKGTVGTMQVDYEERINFDRLRQQRLEKIHRAMEETNLGSLLLFDPGNKRYATSTAVASPEVDQMGRYAILPREGKPYIFGFGSEVAAEKLYCPWIAERAFPAHTTMMGALPGHFKASESFIKDVFMVLKEHQVDQDPVGVDILDSQLILALQAAGFKLGDGQDVMLEARAIKTEDEIMIIRQAAATVDAAFDRMASILKPGIRENDLQAEASFVLHTLGAQWVINIQITSGPRTHPHPHLSSDRVLQPGDLVFADIVTMLNGYHTCYYRTLCCGPSNSKQRDMYQRAYEMLQKGIDKLRAGNTTADVCRAWPPASYWGFQSESQAFGLAFGHGVGVGLWERPIIHRLYSMNHPVELKEEMVIALETYDGEGIDGARIEEMAVITEGDPEIISKFPCQELISCGGKY
jgi:Xaa-Pro aminopeptidase